jgi:hypothetical protein
MSPKERKILTVCAIIAILQALLCCLCSSVVCQEPLVPQPDPPFQEVSRIAPEIRSVFGDEFPEATNRQVLVQQHLYLACVDIVVLLNDESHCFRSDSHLFIIPLYRSETCVRLKLLNR